MIILGNCFSLLGSICSILATRGKSHKKVLLIQSLDAFFFTLSCLCLGGYSGVVINSCSVIRNLSCALLPINKIVKIIFIIIIFSLGIIFRDDVWYGFLPIIASTLYTIAIVSTKDIKKLKTYLIINNLLWLIYGIIIFDIVGVCFKSIVIISCIQYLLKNKKTHSD